jgi:Immunity protein Imm1
MSRIPHRAGWPDTGRPAPRGGSLERSQAVAALDIHYARGHEDNPVTVTTADAVDVLIDGIRAESPESAPILMEVHISGDPYNQGPDVGINGDHGVLRYSGRDWPEGIHSTGNGPTDGEPLRYFYMDTYTDFPSNADIPLTTIRQAVREFLATLGARPNCVEWQRPTPGNPVPLIG